MKIMTLNSIKIIQLSLMMNIEALVGSIQKKQITKMEKIEKLKRIFKIEKIDGYVVPKNDEFFGEYTPDHNDRLNFISNFQDLLVSSNFKKKNYLFVDGRYSLQANNQSGKFFKIVTIPDKMPSDILKKKKMTIGFDQFIYKKIFITIFREKSM